MRTNFITFGGVDYAVVFRVVNHEPQVLDKYSAEFKADLRAWLQDGNYPQNGELLMKSADANLPEGFYIKPYMNNRYFQVQDDNSFDEVDATQFGESIMTENFSHLDAFVK